MGGGESWSPQRENGSNVVAARSNQQVCGLVCQRVSAGNEGFLGEIYISRKQGNASVVCLQTFTGKYSYTVYEGGGVLCDHVVPGAERCMFVDSHLCGKEIKCADVRVEKIKIYGLGVIISWVCLGLNRCISLCAC